MLETLLTEISQYWDTFLAAIAVDWTRASEPDMVARITFQFLLLCPEFPYGTTQFGSKHKVPVFGRFLVSAYRFRLLHETALVPFSRSTGEKPFEKESSKISRKRLPTT